MFRILKIFLVDEVPLEDLIPFDDLVPQPNEQAPLPQQVNIHLVFVETFIPPVDPMQVAASSKSKDPSAAAIRCWAKHFSPIDRTKPIVTIPTEWMDFFLSAASESWLL
jgi:hypothetical protein